MTNLISLSEARKQRQRSRVSVVFLSSVSLVVVDHPKHLIMVWMIVIIMIMMVIMMMVVVKLYLPTLIARTLFVEGAPDRLVFIIHDCSHCHRHHFQSNDNIS